MAVAHLAARNAEFLGHRVESVIDPLKKGTIVLEYDLRVGADLAEVEVRSVDLSWCSLLTDDTARALATCTNLQSVNLSYCPLLTDEAARALDLPFLFTERSEGTMVLRRGFGVAPGQRVVVIEDVVTTGRSTREVIDILEGLGAAVIGVASMINRSGIAQPFAPLPSRSLLEVDFPTWSQDDCPLCREGVPISKPGSRPIT